MSKIRVTIWNEYLHEVEKDVVRALYPEGLHGALAAGIAPWGDFEIRTATLRQPEHGLTDAVLASTDVLLWWGHMAHDQVSDAIVRKVHDRVLGGMGLIVLHSGHRSKIFQRVLGSDGWLRWREADEKERLWNLMPSHPILEGIGEYVELEQEEMYGEPFGVPSPDETLMISWFQGGEVFRSLCTWQRGHGKVVYFRPGHETYPTYHHETVLRIIGQAARWARRRVEMDPGPCPESPALEPVPNPTKEHIL